MREYAKTLKGYTRVVLIDSMTGEAFGTFNTIDEALNTYPALDMVLAEIINGELVIAD